MLSRGNDKSSSLHMLQGSHPFLLHPHSLPELQLWLCAHEHELELMILLDAAAATAAVAVVDVGVFTRSEPTV